MLGLSALFSAGSYVSCQYLDLLPVSDSPRYQSKENEILRAAPYCLFNPRGSYSNTNLVSDIEEHCVMNKGFAPYLPFSKFSFRNTKSYNSPTGDISNVTPKPRRAKMEQTGQMRCYGCCS